MGSAAQQSKAEGGWSGDLRDLAMRLWAEDGDLAAVMLTIDGKARGWMNLRHVDSPSLKCFVWLWIRHAAKSRPPVAVLWADDLAPLRALDAQGAQEA